MRNRDSKERTKSWGRGLRIEGSQIIRNNCCFFFNQCVLQSELVRRAVIAQRKLGICCKFRWEFYPKTSFFSLVQFCMKVWPYDWSRDGYQISHPEGRNIPTKSFSPEMGGKNSVSNNQSLGRQIGTTFFFFFSLQPPFYFLLEIRLQTWVTIHKYLVVLCCRELWGEKTQKKVILKSFALTHANKLYASQ